MTNNIDFPLLAETFGLNVAVLSLIFCAVYGFYRFNLWLDRRKK